VLLRDTTEEILFFNSYQTLGRQRCHSTDDPWGVFRLRLVVLFKEGGHILAILGLGLILSNALHCIFLIP
jgi:hypothetical protein